MTRPPEACCPLQWMHPIHQCLPLTLRDSISGTEITPIAFCAIHPPTHPLTSLPLPYTHCHNSHLSNFIYPLTLGILGSQFLTKASGYACHFISTTPISSYSYQRESYSGKWIQVQIRNTVKAKLYTQF